MYNNLIYIFQWLCCRSPKRKEKFMSWRFQYNWTSEQRIVWPGRTGKEEVNRWPKL